MERNQITHPNKKFLYLPAVVNSNRAEYCSQKMTIVVTDYSFR